ncbi:topology modulation protein [Mangrovihabitans endophyticus]|uniref:DNA topology modulation protein FlaR n=1 Tax=Mangrovihabitans endophyticus TaxID=1751298 RepID=A0A8J3BUF4_9ACTN|nr:topology modulation protein [Mangrovihabitans endophyticus]GGK79390.1 DNA topology modulation protein FlaR [Mangrovihabitans endophyticus]
MQRIAILGASGAGKTVLARTLGDLLDLPVTHLDQLRYDSDWNVIAEPDFVAAQHQLVAGTRWIADGNSLASLPVRAAAADTIIVLDPHPLVCLTGIAARRLRYRGGQHADGVYDRITLEVLTYAATYRARHLPRVQACLREHATRARVVHLRSRRAVTRYVAQVRAVGRSSS